MNGHSVFGQTAVDRKNNLRYLSIFTHVLVSFYITHCISSQQFSIEVTAQMTGAEKYKVYFCQN